MLALTLPLSMERLLNRTVLEETLIAKGLTQSSLADRLGLTRAAVSKWFTGKSAPRPPELLRLGRLLGLSHAQLVQPPAPSDEPLVAFRKRASTRTTPDHVAHAREMGRLLAPIVPHLPFNRFLSPRRLKHPTLNYEYIQALVAELRKDLKLDPTGEIKFTDLIGKFEELQAVLVPVMWGLKKRHENALHIYLPESKTTWIYLNLDSRLHDFKFWMAHELGHVLAVDLLTSGSLDAAEDFSDAFAGALLFPEAAAKPVYEAYQASRLTPTRIGIVAAAARAHLISPNSVYLELEGYANARGLAFDPLPKNAFYAALASLNKTCSSVTENLFDGNTPSADHFMRVCSDVFKTPIFTALGSYLKTAPNGEALIGRVLDVPLPDAKELRQALV
jgi:transcriptional regulator with XRE-family HTH domain